LQRPRGLVPEIDVRRATQRRCAGGTEETIAPEGHLAFLSQPAAVSYEPWSVASYPLWKRTLDISLGGLLAACALPVLGVAIVTIKVVDGGPVMFWQRRVGQGGREFWFPKLRSMHPGAENSHHTLRSRSDHADSIKLKVKADPRVTPIGRVLRTLSIDELPQFWCVLTGEMSLVGPRPHPIYQVQMYSPWQRRRLEVKPGITGLWQVCGRSTIPFDGQIALDVEYVRRHSLRLDLAILARTVRAVISCVGAW
jgi:lipopolysaccharide/colanic/teichoic acid biosynthesis glycosyltransferase